MNIKDLENIVFWSDIHFNYELEDFLVELDSLLTQPIDESIINKSLTYALVSFCNIRIIAMLLDHGANINTFEDNFPAPLILALITGRKNERSLEDVFELVSLLLKKGADVNANTRFGRNVFIDALERELSVKTLKLFLKHGANLGSNYNDFRNPLHTALIVSSYDNSAIIKTLLEHGADINARDNNGNCVLEASMRCKDYDKIKYNINIVKLLLEHGADVNARNNRGETALMAAVRSSYIDNIKYLIDYGADVNARDDDGNTVFMKAACSNPNDDIYYSFKHGADINNCKKYEKKLKLLMIYGADINAKNNFGDTTLIHLMRSSIYFSGRSESISILTKLGVKIEEKDKYGCTPFTLAVIDMTSYWLTFPLDEDLDLFIEKNRADMWRLIEIFIKLGANIETRDCHGATPLMFASAFDNPQNKIIEKLVECGANINARDENGATPLMWAIGKTDNPTYLKCVPSTPSNMSQNIIRLIKLGARNDCKDKYGKTAWDYVRMNPELKNTDGYWALNETRYD